MFLGPNTNKRLKLGTESNLHVLRITKWPENFPKMESELVLIQEKQSLWRKHNWAEEWGKWNNPMVVLLLLPYSCTWDNGLACWLGRGLTHAWGTAAGTQYRMQHLPEAGCLPSKFRQPYTLFFCDSTAPSRWTVAGSSGSLRMLEVVALASWAIRIWWAERW